MSPLSYYCKKDLRYGDKLNVNDLLTDHLLLKPFPKVEFCLG